MDSDFRQRIKRRLYYQDVTEYDRPSLPLTEFTVEYFKESVSQKLGHIDIDDATDILRKNNVSPCSMVVSLLYARRLRQKAKSYTDAMSSSDVFFISMMMASKYMYDEGVDEEVYNDEWAENTSQEVKDVNTMETDFLDALDWQLFVRPDEFETALADIEKRLAWRQGVARGWFTYAELAVLADAGLLRGLWGSAATDAAKMSMIISAAYISSFLSFLGSAALSLQIAAPLSSALVSSVSHLACLSLTAQSGLGLPLSLSLGDPGVSILPLGFEQNLTLLDAPPDLEMGASSLDVTSSFISDLPARSEPSSQNIDHNDADNSSEKEEAVFEQGRRAKSSLMTMLFVDSLLSQIMSSTTCKQVSQDNEEVATHGHCSYSKRKSKKIENGNDRLNSSQQASPYGPTNNYCSIPFGIQDFGTFDETLVFPSFDQQTKEHKCSCLSAFPSTEKSKGFHWMSQNDQILGTNKEQMMERRAPNKAATLISPHYRPPAIALSLPPMVEVT